MILMNENHPLYNRSIHISGKFKIREKANVHDLFTSKTASQIEQLMEEIGYRKIFGRSDIQRILGLKPTRSSALLKEMANHGIIEPVSGHGKGRYRFR